MYLGLNMYFNVHLKWTNIPTGIYLISQITHKTLTIEIKYSYALNTWLLNSFLQVRQPRLALVCPSLYYSLFAPPPAWSNKEHLKIYQTWGIYVNVEKRILARSLPEIDWVHLKQQSFNPCDMLCYFRPLGVLINLGI